MTREEVIAKIEAFVQSEYGIAVDDPSADMRDSLGLDSLDLTEMVFAIEEMFSVEIAAPELYRCRTLNDVADIFVKKIVESAARADKSRNTAGV